MTAVALPLNGGCLCGHMRYQVSELPRLVYTCHCTDCQHITGSAFSMAFVVGRDGFRVDGAMPRELASIADSGRVKVRCLCPDCGCWVYSLARPDNGLRRVRAGTLDDTSRLCPSMHFWTRNKQPWLTLPAGGVVYETQPEA